MRVELLLVPDCPNAAAARQVVRESLAQLGVTVPIVERVGPFPSPTVLVDGRDVLGVRVDTDAGACRIDLPTTERVLAAMRASVGRSDESDAKA
ncbi:MAG: alkylmercury lyase [Pseudonocardia sp.]|nr:alkylmercury lyase [Pseudonocardia sp.]